MRADPQTGRAALLGAGLGLGLVLLEAGAPRGSWGGLTPLVSLLPVALALALGGPAAAGVAVAVALGGTVFTLGGGATLALALKQVLPGLVLGLSLTRRLSLPLALALVTALSLGGVLTLVWVLAPSQTSPLAYLERQVAAHVSDLGDTLARLGMGSEAGWAADSARLVATAIQVAGLGVIALGVLLGVAVNYLAARLCLRGAGFRPFAEEAAPDHFVWAVIGAGLMLASRIPGLERIGLNLLIVLTPLYAIQGLAVFRHFFVRVRVPRLLQVVSFGLFAMQPLLLVAVACVGLSDLWIDFRKIRQAPTPA